MSTPVSALCPEGAAVAPLISVVLPTFNCASWMCPTLESLAVQTSRDFEVVVSDGASTDDSLALIETYRFRLPALRVLSRPDRGVYDAINLAIGVCEGDWVYVLGSDDCLHEADTLAQISHLLRRSACGMIYGDVRVMGKNSMVADGNRYGGPFTLARLLGQNICHQAIFTRRSLFQRLGLYVLCYKVWADWEFAQRAFVLGEAQWVDMVVADYAATGMSSAQLDIDFQRTQLRRLLLLWWVRPLSLKVPLAWGRHTYWGLQRH
jgi:glycosyltransferase involved in cell wall biosynthesis